MPQHVVFETMLMLIIEDRRGGVKAKSVNMP